MEIQLLGCRSSHRPSLRGGNPFNRAMREVRTSQLKDLELILMNGESEEILRFRKGD